MVSSQLAAPKFFSGLAYRDCMHYSEIYFYHHNTQLKMTFTLAKIALHEYWWSGVCFYVCTANITIVYTYDKCSYFYTFLRGTSTKTTPRNLVPESTIPRMCKSLSPRHPRSPWEFATRSSWLHWFWKWTAEVFQDFLLTTIARFVQSFLSIATISTN